MMKAIIQNNKIMSCKIEHNYTKLWFPFIKAISHALSKNSHSKNHIHIINATLHISFHIYLSILSVHSLMSFFLFQVKYLKTNDENPPLVKVFFFLYHFNFIYKIFAFPSSSSIKIFARNSSNIEFLPHELYSRNIWFLYEFPSKKHFFSMFFHKKSFIFQKIYKKTFFRKVFHL